LVVEAFPFEVTLAAEPEIVTIPQAAAPTVLPLPPWLQKLIGNKNPSVAAGIAAGIVLASLALPVVIFERAGKKKITSAQAAHALEQTKPKEAPATADQVEQAVQGPNRRAHVGTSPKKMAAALAQLSLPIATTSKTDLLAKHLNTEGKKDPTAMAQVVRSWLSGDD
jgi:flagellar biosynthesis/type III secretory pathway M-ring protein FliF/YscJ